MACTGRYAEAMNYLVIFQCGALYVGLDNSVGKVGAAFVDDTLRDWNVLRIAVGMPIYNATTKQYGKVTAVTSSSQLATTGLTWSSGDTYWLLPTAANEVATIEAYLDLAAGDIHAARAAVNGCSCTLASGMTDYLRHLNCVLAAVWHQCPCGQPNINDTQRQGYLTWAQAQLDAITSGKLELCAGETGSLYPAIAIAELGHTVWNQERIMLNYVARNP